MTVNSVPLVEVALINPPHSSRVDTDRIISFLGMADVTDTGATSLGKDYRYAEVSKGYTPFRDGDLLVAKITPCFQNGKIAQARLRHEIGAGSTEFHVVRPRERVDARYLLWFLRQRWIRREGEHRMTGSGGQRRVPEAYLRDLKIPLPSLDEQKRVATALDQVETLRAKRRKTISLLDDLTQAIFLDMFGDPLRNPKGWSKMRMRDFLSRIESGKSPQCLGRPAGESEWGVLKLGAVTQGSYIPSENKALPEGLEVDQNNEVRVGDLLFTRKNTPELVAACAYVHETRGRLLLPDLIFRLDVAEDAPVSKIYLHALLSYPPKRKKVQELASGSAASMPNISKRKLLDFVCETPTLDLQREFAERAGGVEGQKVVHRTHLAALDELFTSLQQRAFSGTLWEDQAA